MPLTVKQIENAKPASKPYKLYDGDGLFLLVHPNGGRYWRRKYRDAAGREQTRSYGVFPKVSLAKARQLRDADTVLLEEGTDPAAATRAAKRERSGADRFDAVAKQWMAVARTNSGGRDGVPWSAKHEARLQTYLDAYLLPALGEKRMDAIDAQAVLAALAKVQERGALHSAKKVKSLAFQVFGFAVAHGLASRNPLADLPRNILPSKPVKHHAAITDPAKVGQLLRDIRGYNGYIITRAALELLALVFTRPGEVRLAEWTEIDLEGGTWEIPAGRMKMRSSHLVPLSKQAVAILRDVHTVSGRGRLVFPGVRHLEKPLSENTFNAALRQIGYDKGTMTSHGFRATARTLLDEQLHFPVVHIEHQLAHTVRDPLGRAYNRTSFLAERRTMMQRWADYLDELAAGAAVIKFPAVQK